MKVAYDVPTQKKHNSYGDGKYSKVFWPFYESEHKSARIEYASDKESKSAQRAFLMIISRNNIHDVIVIRQEEVIFLEKEEKRGREETA